LQQEGQAKLERELYYYEYVNRIASEVVAELVSPSHTMFKAATESAVAEAHRFREQLRVEIAGLDIGKDVVIEVGQPEDKGYAVFIPIKWRAESQAGLFPSMDAELEVMPLSDRQPLTQIGILGRYRPPIGVFGAIGDAMLGHRVAEASVRHFVIDLAARLREQSL
jgi:hypothetical protein